MGGVLPGASGLDSPIAASGVFAMSTLHWNRRRDLPPSIPFEEALKLQHKSLRCDEAAEFWRKVGTAACPEQRDFVDAGVEAVSALDDISRRIDDLARQLNCLGFFDDQPGP